MTTNNQMDWLFDVNHPTVSQISDVEIAWCKDWWLAYPTKASHFMSRHRWWARGYNYSNIWPCHHHTSTPHVSLVIINIWGDILCSVPPPPPPQVCQIHQYYCCSCCHWRSRKGCLLFVNHSTRKTITHNQSTLDSCDLAKRVIRTYCYALICERINKSISTKVTSDDDE